MQHTLIAVFDNRVDAHKACEALVAAGFAQQQVLLTEGEPGGQTEHGDGHAVGARIRHFFSDLFGIDRSEHAQMYAGAVTSGHHVLTLTADSAPEAERAADIVARFGPVDIDEHAQEWSGPGAAQAMPSPPAGASMQRADPGAEAARQPSPRQPAMQGGSMQGGTAASGPQPWAGQPDSGGTANPVVDDALQVGKRAVRSGGVRIYQRRTEVEIALLAPEDDTDFRRHWRGQTGAGGSYDEYAPAYAFGSAMARHGQYQGQRWDEVESTLRSDWEARYPQSAWDKFKAAVRHGWDRITS